MFQAQVHAHERSIPGAVATAGVDARREFLKRTYGHLLGAILAFVGLEFLLVSPSSPLFESISVPTMRAMAGSQWSWLVVLGLFMVVGHVASRFASSDTSRGMQYVGLALYVVAESLIFMPLLFIAANVARYDGVIPVAGLATVLIFVGLTATVFLTRKDFSFLRGALSVASMAALGVIVCSLIFGFSLGVIFTVAMIGLAAGYVLYYTSQVLAHFRPSQHVAASLALFAAIALLFWYVLRLFMSSRD
jgi:FtsH-binding integral membrane protein